MNVHTYMYEHTYMYVCAYVRMHTYIVCVHLYAIVMCICVLVFNYLCKFTALITYCKRWLFRGGAYRCGCKEIGVAVRK